MEDELRVRLNDHQVSKVFPVKPKSTAKPVSKSETPDSRYWSSFKPHSIPNLDSSVVSFDFSPIYPHSFLVAHSASVSLFSSHTLSASRRRFTLKDVVSSVSFRSDGALFASADLSGDVQVFDVTDRTPLRTLRSHQRPARFVKYPNKDKLHLVSGGDDGVVKYWDVAGATVISDLLGHKDYVRCAYCSPVSDSVFVTGSYDHTVKVWDARVENSKWVAEINHGSPVEDVVYLPSGGMIATAGGSSVKVWDLIGGGNMVCSMESHNKTVTSLCVGKMGVDQGAENRLVSVALDGYMKVFDYGRAKVTYSMRFPAPLMSVGLSPDSSVRVIGGSNGVVFAGKKKAKDVGEQKKKSLSFWSVESQVDESKRALRPTYYRYFQRGQSEKPSQGDFLVKEKKGVKLARHDKLLKKFRHKDALVAVLEEKKPANVVAVMEELVARRKLIRCVSNLEQGELGMLLSFLQRYCTVQRYSGLLMGLARKVLETRAEDIKGKEEFKGLLRNLKREINQEIKIQQSLLEIQGVIAPLMRIAGRR